MTHEEIELLCFDPEHIGIPRNPQVSGLAQTDEMFVEIFLAVEDLTIRDAGFLTNVGGLGLACADIWCRQAISRQLSTAFSMTEHNIVRQVPEDMHTPTLWNTAALCARAGQLAIRQALLHGREAAGDAPLRATLRALYPLDERA